jgi:hypothetical protein
VADLRIIATRTHLHSSFLLSLKFSTDLVHFLIQIYGSLIAKWQKRTSAPHVSGCHIRHDPDAVRSGQQPLVPSFIPLSKSVVNNSQANIFFFCQCSLMSVAPQYRTNFISLSGSWNFETASRFLEKFVDPWPPYDTDRIVVLSSLDQLQIFLPTFCQTSCLSHSVYTATSAFRIHALRTHVPANYSRTRL